jgi:hypothetical protein
MIGFFWAGTGFAVFKPMKNIFVILSVLSGLLPLKLLASDTASAQCSSPQVRVDMRQQFGEIHNKGRVGWCYAYSASDLLGFWLRHNFSQQIGAEQVSATAVALAFHQDAREGAISSAHELLSRRQGYEERAQSLRQQVSQLQSRLAQLTPDAAEFATLSASLEEARDGLSEAERKRDRNDIENIGIDEGGDARTAITLSLQRGICFESSLSSRALSEISPAEQQALQQLGMTEMTVYQLDQSLRREVARQSGENNSALEVVMHRLFSRSSDITAAQVLAQADPLGFLFTRQCQDIQPAQIARPQMTALNTVDHSEAEMFSFIRDTLDSQRPLEVGYNSSIFNRPGGHSSVLIGYRQNCDGHYDYLLRNSWGEHSCEENLGELAANGQNPGFNCDPQGYYWVSEATLSSTLAQAVRLENN